MRVILFFVAFFAISFVSAECVSKTGHDMSSVVEQEIPKSLQVAGHGATVNLSVTGMKCGMCRKENRKNKSRF